MTHDDQFPSRERWDDLPPLMTIPRAAEFLGVSRASAYRYAATGDLPTLTLGRRTYVVTARLRHILDDPHEQEAA